MEIHVNGQLIMDPYDVPKLGSSVLLWIFESFENANLFFLQLLH